MSNFLHSVLYGLLLIVSWGVGGLFADLRWAASLKVLLILIAGVLAYAFIVCWALPEKMSLTATLLFYLIGAIVMLGFGWIERRYRHSWW